MTTRQQRGDQPGEERAELKRATAAANEIFARMGQVVQEAVDGGETELNVLDVARRAGLEIEEKDLAELQIDRVILVHPWLPWHHWWPWRPIWCWWWHKYFWWYRCCPYWWHRCHWYPW